MADDDLVFKALADPPRIPAGRAFASDGRTPTRLESGLEMTGFGVTKHLKVLQIPDW